MIKKAQSVSRARMPAMLVLLVCFLFCVLALIIAKTDLVSVGEVSVKAGEQYVMNMKIQKRELDLSRVIDLAFAEGHTHEQQLMTALLNRHNFYHIRDENLLHALEQIDYTSYAARKLREMALASVGPFKDVPIEVDIRIVDPDHIKNGHAIVCINNNNLVGKYLILIYEDAHDTRLVSVYVAEPYPCVNPAGARERLLVRINRSDASKLFGGIVSTPSGTTRASVQKGTPPSLITPNAQQEGA